MSITADDKCGNCGKGLLNLKGPFLKCSNCGAWYCPDCADEVKRAIICPVCEKNPAKTETQRRDRSL